MSSKAKATFDVDIAVVGGGPGGLATAAAIHAACNQDVTVEVYESYKAYRLQGAGVLMQPNVQYALEAINPKLLKKFETHSIKHTGVDMFLEDGTCDASIPAGSSGNDQELFDKYGKVPFIFGWHEIRQLLFDHLPDGIVHFDTQVTHYNEDEEGVTVHFSGNTPPRRAKLLVGADGYFSKIRSQCLDDGPPDFVGTVMWRARVPWQEGMPHPHTALARLFGNARPWPLDHKRRFGMLFKIGTLEDTKDRAWCWVLSAPIELLRAAGVAFDPNAKDMKSLQGESGGADSALRNAEKVFGDFPDSIMDIVRSTDPSTVTQHGLYMRNLGHNQYSPTSAPPSTPTQGTPAKPMSKSSAVAHDDSSLEPQEGKDEAWGKGCVTLLGDAAHATIPNGQGLSLAIEDAVVLAWHLQQQGVCQSALRSYEEERPPRVKAVHEKGTDSAAPEHKEGLLFKPYFKPLWRQQSPQDAQSNKHCIVNFDP